MKHADVLTQRLKGRSMKRVVILSSFIALASVLSTTSAPAGTPSWSAYLFGPRHTSYAIAAMAFTPTTAATVSPDWTFRVPAPTLADQPGRGLFASPTVSGGVVYIGANTGLFYAVDEVSGKELWHHDLGYTTHKTCFGRGITSTATIAPDPSRSGQLTVYVGGGDGYLYALRATDGALVWRSRVVNIGTTQNSGYIWGSPTVIGGRIYIGISSQCDKPLIRGGLRAFTQTTGALAATYWGVPSGSRGASGWTSAASDGVDVWMTLGNGDTGDSFAIVRLDAQTLIRQDSWVVPNTNGTDLDWGSSPTLFKATIAGVATPMVGGCNKNGRYYALKANDLAAGPVWNTRLGVTGDLSAGSGACLAAAIWDFTNQRLFVGSNKTTVAGMSTPGSVRELDPSTGAVVWARPLAGGPIMGSPTLSGGGVIAAGTYNSAGSANRIYLLSAADGSVVNSIPESSSVFAQPVFADTHLFVATSAGTLTSFSAVG
ncbi:MAG: hypothetical protein QOE83_366 [Actinomycetota bacterium]|jgi:outer membrane protein assembly factor BamB|nr:hypothetical protein [Actinomycetota bacterium]